jgi:hypothetical protein
MGHETRIRLSASTRILAALSAFKVTVPLDVVRLQFSLSIFSWPSRPKNLALPYLEAYMPCGTRIYFCIGGGLTPS